MKLHQMAKGFDSKHSVTVQENRCSRVVYVGVFCYAYSVDPPPMAQTEISKLWTQRPRRFDQTDTTVADFCASESISQASFYFWKRKLGRPGAEADRPLRSCPSRWGNPSIVQTPPLPRSSFPAAFAFAWKLQVRRWADDRITDQHAHLSMHRSG
jgi:hypothetical protein